MDIIMESSSMYMRKTRMNFCGEKLKKPLLKTLLINSPFDMEV